MGDKLFRTSVVGGYNREDVNSYISKLEAELMRVQKQLGEQVRQWEEPRRERKPDTCDDVIILSDSPQEAGKTNNTEKPPKEKASAEANIPESACEGQEKELAAARLELERVSGELIDARVELGISKQRCEESEHKREALLELFQRMAVNYSGLQTSQYYPAEQVENTQTILLKGRDNEGV